MLPLAQVSSFDIAWSDVPHVTDATCPAAAALEVTPPGETRSVRIQIATFRLAPCNGGAIFVYPLKVPGTGQA